MDEGERIDPAILLAEYREVYTHYLHNSRFMWQVYSLATLISGGLIIASFAYVEGKDLWWVRDLVLLIAGIIATSLLIHVKKYRYFAEISVGTLSRLEDTLGTKRIQRTTQVESDVPREDNSQPEYWYKQKPEDRRGKLEGLIVKQSADKWLGYSMYVLLAIVIACIIINTVVALTC